MKTRMSVISAVALLATIALFGQSVPARAQDATPTPEPEETSVPEEPTPEQEETPVPAVTETPAPEPEAFNGTLLNGGFEGQFTPFASFPNAVMASDWLPWWVGRTSAESLWANVRPEFQPSTTIAHSGASAQRYYTEFGTHQAGVMQRIDGVNAGDIVEFKVWVRTWSSNQDNPCCSLESGLISIRAGIDPTGGTNPYASTVVWTDPIRNDDVWTELAVSATITGDAATVFVFSTPKYPVKHNEVYIDDATFTVTGSAPVPPEIIPDPDELEDPFALSEPFEPDDDIVSGPLIYSIQEGDTVESVADLFNIEVEDLLDANGLNEDSPLFVAGQLVIPGLTFVAPSMVAIYTIQSDDSLSSVAAAFDSTIYVLAQLNGIVNYASVTTGTEILVPISTGE